MVLRGKNAVGFVETRIHAATADRQSKMTLPPSPPFFSSPYFCFVHLVAQIVISVGVILLSLDLQALVQTAKRLREKMQHLVGCAFGQKIFHVGFGQSRKTNLDFVGREDFDFRSDSRPRRKTARRPESTASCDIRRADRRSKRRRGCIDSSILRPARPPCRIFPSRSKPESPDASRRRL